MNDASHILRTKLNSPKSVNDHVHRVRLVEKLNNNYQKNALTLVSAPAGYGKSYLVSCWLRENKIPFGWISLDEEENDLRSFLEYFVASVEKVSLGKLEKTSGLLQAAELPPLSVIINNLINELDEIDKEFVLVLDDYHLIKEKKIHDLIDGLLQYPPGNMVLCIITRRDPPLKIGPLRAYNRFNEIRTKDLLFTLQEIPILYKNMTGLNLNEQISERLLKKTEGWVTGLRLTALSVKTIEQLESILQRMKIENRLISDYLVEEVLKKLPEEFQKYLMKTSLLDRFCAEVIEVLDITESTEKEKRISGVEFIKWLEKTNLFVIPLDDEQKWFRYHHEFQKLLQKQLKKKRSPEQINSIYKKASEWFENNGLIDEAIHHAMEGGHIDKAVAYIEINRDDKLNQDQWYVVKRWLSKIPNDIMNQSAFLLLTRARILNHEFNLLEVPEIIKRLESMLKGESLSQALMAEFYFSKAFIFFWLGEIDKCLKYSIETKNKIPTDEKYDMIRGDNELYYSIAHQMKGNGNKAVRELKELINASKTKKGMYFSRVVASLCFVQMLMGELKAIEKPLTQLTTSSGKSNFTYTDTWSGYMNACRYFNLSQFDEALQNFITITDRINIMHGFQALHCLAGLSFTYQFLNQTNEAYKIMIQLSEFANRSQDIISISLAESAKARLSLLQGDLKSAEDWLRKSDVSFNSSLLFIWIETSAITACRVLLAIGSPESLNKAVIKIKELLAETKRTNNIFHTIDLLVLQSLTFYKLSMTAKASKVLKEALSLAAPREFMRPFIEPGDQIITVLKELEKQDIYTEFINDILKKFSEHKNISGSGLNQNNVNTVAASLSLNDPLTNREIEILTYLAKGLRNKDIANKISLAPTTVKKHIHNICKKLDVHSRNNAVIKAQESGIILKKN